MTTKPPSFLSSLATLPKAGGTAGDARVVDAGELVVTSGTVVACDGLIIDPRGALKTALPAGAHRVLLGRVDRDNAWAMLVGTGAPVTSWHADDEGKGGPRGYAVDSGNGCFVDAAGAEAIERAEEAESAAIVEEIDKLGVDDSDPEAWHKAFSEIREKRRVPDLQDQLRAAGLDKKGTASVVVDKDSGANLVAFKAGAGDGAYATWVGLDASGAVACLVTDFGLFEEAAEAPVDEDGGDEEEDEGDADEAPADVDPAEALRKLFAMLVASKKIELAPGAKLDVLAKQAVPVLRKGGAEALYEWLFEQTEVDEVYLTDEELEEILAAW